MLLAGTTVHSVATFEIATVLPFQLFIYLSLSYHSPRFGGECEISFSNIGSQADELKKKGRTDFDFSKDNDITVTLERRKLRR